MASGEGRGARNGLFIGRRVSFEVARFLHFRAKGPVICIAQPNGLGVVCDRS